MKYALLSVVLAIIVCAIGFILFHNYIPLEKVETTACQKSMRKYYVLRGQKDEFDIARKADPSYGSNFDSTCQTGNMDTVELYL